MPSRPHNGGMSDYRPPLSDINFILEHVVGYPEIAGLPGYEHADLDTAVELLGEFGYFVSEVIAPTNRAGDVEGATRHPDGTVTTPSAFPGIYQKYTDAGWGALPFPEQFGGGGFPWLVGLAMHELLNSANTSFALAPLLTQGSIDALLHYGTPEQQELYVPKLVSGEWTGTMNLTEPQAGSDVGALKTQAVRQDDGTYRISGQKIFISFGDHDLADQIIHLVLARTPDAPEGTRGISCFIVPKRHLNDDGSLGERNGVHTLSIEEKMGIHGSPTCVLEYDDATGYLIGEENKGMRIMFVMMNMARLSVGTQGVAVAERAYQHALAYAQERRQGLAIGAEGVDSAIIEHPDVRRMLLTQRALIAAARRMMFLNAAHMDRVSHGTDEDARQRSSEIVGLLTPLCKTFGTDVGVDVASLALQVFGGMGFIEETGAAQFYRDARIMPIYEGTNGIQAADLVGRKMPVRDGASFLEFIQEMREIDGALEAAGEDFASIRAELGRQFDALEKATTWMLRTGMQDPNSVLAGSSPYQRMWCLVVGGWLLARSALAAAGLDGSARAEAELVTARFFAEQLLPQAGALLSAATAGSRDLFALDVEALGGRVKV